MPPSIETTVLTVECVGTVLVPICLPFIVRRTYVRSRVVWVGCVGCVGCDDSIGCVGGVVRAAIIEGVTHVGSVCSMGGVGCVSIDR